MPIKIVSNPNKTDKFPVHRIWLTDDENNILKVPDDCDNKGIKFLISEARNMIIYIGIENLEYFKDYFGEKGIRSFYGMSSGDSVKMIEDCIRKLPMNEFPEKNYYEKNINNVERTLGAMLIFAQVAPAGIWQGE